MNKKMSVFLGNTVVIFCVLLFMAIIFTGCVSTKTGTPIQAMEYQLFNSTFGKYSANVAMEKMPEAILVYKTEKSVYTCEWGEKFAQRLGLFRGCYKTNGGFYINETIYGGRSVDVRSDIGLIRFSDLGRKDNYPDKDKPVNLPPDDQVIRNVTDFLMSQNLLFTDAVFRGISFVELEHRNESNRKEITRGSKFVSFDRTLNSRRVVGSKIRVEVGENFDILDIWINWRNYTPYKEAPLRSVESAFEEFTTRELWCSGFSGSSDNVTVTNVTLVYYSQVPAAAGNEKYLQPVYVFESIAKQGNKTSSCTPLSVPATVERFEETY
ncbi:MULTISPECIES: hypothetical protein [unclassified Methanoregula]|uniref:hypothetical protein n=1 Tax=unclassified Methanoregula TaxID=2649730 RepID=UPI0009C8B72A|nr:MULTISPECIES: hypothetical protein [unclassified Methanoregula]OPX63222.1 MAG: hypothetical protein A4E33_01905 [Methanoregula sp. PtaB.Bin085]OPY33522.1 MAG: hypothetical protein A4E34_01845 [Methanoregula sp. PtaU1.Bin006]